MRVTLASYNIHSGVGSDGRFDPLRTLRVLQALGADVIALQEVAFRHGTGHETLAFLAEETGMHAVAGPTLLRHDAHYGNALLSRWPVLAEHRLDLSFPGREPRGAIGATIACGGDQRLQIVTTHLGLRPAERRYQVQRLLELFDAERAVPAVLLGDLNEWLLWGQPLRRLHAYFKETPAPATFPARFPLFALDRVWVRPRSALVHLAANVNELARQASDHLPVTAIVDCPPNAVPLERGTCMPCAD